MTLRKQREQEKLAAEAAAKVAAMLPPSSISASETDTSASGNNGPSSHDTSAPQSPKSSASRSIPTSRRSSTSQNDNEARTRARLHGLNTIEAVDDLDDFPIGPSFIGASIAKGKGPARFADFPREEERGRRGRTSRTPESVGTVQSGSGPSDDAMDWRPKSKSRSRSRSVGAMDWRGASRSISRRRPLPAERRLEVIHDEPDADEKLLSTSAPQTSGFSFSDFAAFDEEEEAGESLWEHVFKGEPSRHQPGNSSQETAAQNQEDHASQRKERMKEDFKAAVHADLFGPAKTDSRTVPFVYGGRKTSMDLASVGAANPFGAPPQLLGSVPGIGDFSSHAANHHPEYGFLPRLVRKTSFDHKVKDRPASLTRMQGRDRSSTTAATLDDGSRKRPFREDQSPARQPYPVPITSDQRLAAGLSRFAPPPDAFINMIPSTSFDFAIPAPPSVQRANAALQNPSAIALLEALAGSQAASPASSGPAAMLSNHQSPGAGSVSSQGAPRGDVTSAPPPTPMPLHEVNAFLNMFMNSDAILSQQQQQSFTHIDPTQLFGHSGVEGMPPAPHPNLLNGTDEASSWGYSPSNSAGSGSVAASPITAHAPSYAPHLSSPLAMSMPARVGAPGGAAFNGSATRPTQNAGPSGSMSSATKSNSGDANTGTLAAGGNPANEPPTQCSNCNTTKTPLWRRDPDGNPLCELQPSFD